MAVIATILSCTLGFLVGLFQVVFLGASIGQGFLTYLAVSVTLSTLSIVLALYRSHAELVPVSHDRQSDLEAWQDWQTEELMEAERLGALIEEREEEDQKRWSA